VSAAGPWCRDLAGVLWAPNRIEWVLWDEMPDAMAARERADLPLHPAPYVWYGSWPAWWASYVARDELHPVGACDLIDRIAVLQDAPAMELP
jgi:hypothetical protein